MKHNTGLKRINHSDRCEVPLNPLAQESRLYLELNPFLANVPTLYPLKTPENHRISGVFKGYKKETLTRRSLVAS